MNATLTRLRIFWTGSIRRRLMLCIGALIALFMMGFVFQTVEHQRQFLRQQADERGMALAKTFAMNSTSWVLAGDTSGLAEVVGSLSSYPDLRYAMVVAPDGRVLAHSDAALVGKYAVDPASEALLRRVPRTREVARTANLVDMAAPIFSSGRLVGWARVGLAQNQSAAALWDIQIRGVAFIGMAILLGLLLASIVGRKLKQNIADLVKSIDAVASGDTVARSPLRRDDELRSLNEAFDAMAVKIEESNRKLRANERESRQLLANLPVPVLVRRNGGDVCYANGEACRTLGMESEVWPENQTIKPDWRLIREDGSELPPEEWPSMVASRTKRAVHNKVYGMITRGSSEPKWLLIHAYPEMDTDGEVTQTVAAYLDITEQKKAQEELHRRAEEFRALVENAPNPILRYDRECRRIYVNAALARMGQKAVSSLLGSQPTDNQLLAPAEAAKLSKWVRQVIETGEETEGVVQFRNADGQLRYMHIRNAPERDRQGEVASVLSISTDITSVMDAEQRLRSLVDNLPDVVTRFDTDGRFIYVSPNVAHAFDQPAEFILGRLIEEVGTPENEVTIARLANSVRTVINNGQPDILLAALKFQDGSVRDFEMRHIPEKDASGNVLSVLAISRDVTERSRAEATQRRLYRELQAIGDCNQALVRAEDEKSLLNEICRIICDQAGYLMTWVGYTDEDEDKIISPVAWAGFEDGYLSDISPNWGGLGNNPSGDAIITGNMQCIQDIEAEASNLLWREEGIRRGYRSLIALPIKNQDGETFAAIAIYSGEPNAFTADEIRLLAELGSDLAFGIRVLRGRTGLQSTAEMLQKSEQEFRTLAETLPDPIIRYDGDYACVYLNQTAAAMEEGATGPLLGSRPTESWQNSQAMAFYEDRLREVIDTGNSADFEFAMENEAPGHGGKVLKVHIVPERNLDGEIIGALAIGRDITELKQREQHYREIFKNVSEGMYLLEVLDCGRFRFLEVNDALALSMGIPVEALIGQYVDDILQPEAASVLTALAEYAVREARVIHADTELDLPSGHRYYSSSFIPVRNTAGWINRVVAISRDVTERRKSEENVRQLSAAVEQSPVSVFITNSLGQILYVNPAFMLTTGYSANEVLGRTPAMFSGGLTSPKLYSELWRTIKSGQSWCGTFQNRRKDGTLHWVEVIIAPIRDDNGQIERYVAIEQDITARKAAEERVEFLAHHDSLTGLPNRLFGKEYMELGMRAADREGGKAALIFLDLDGFKRINDSLGHSVGDGLLIGVAQRLKQLVDGNCLVARQGGDEFLMMLFNIRDLTVVRAAAAKVLDSLARPFHIDGHELSVSASVGIAVYPDDGDDWETLFRKADIAMYSAKETCRNTYRFFAQRMNRDADDNLRIRNRLQGALQRGEMALRYQPKVNIKTGAVVGMEALLRWNCPELGSVSPARFIPLAEDTGLIVPIGEWALREACNQAARWHQSGMPGLVMAVNLSAVQFHSGNVLGAVIYALAESGLDPSLLELEMTESIVMKDTNTVLTLINRLKGLGVSLSIDDFGTGFSGLSYLKRFNADKVKIDQSFVRDIAKDANSAAIVTAIVQMARTLGMTTVAEGVDAPEILDVLRERGCDEAQGYYFAEPLAPEAVPDFMSTFHERDQHGVFTRWALK